MALRYVWPYSGKRFLANTNKDEVHDLLNEKDACNIDLIKPQHIKMYTTLEAAHEDNFDNCDHCLGGSQH